MSDFVVVYDSVTVAATAEAAAQPTMVDLSSQGWISINLLSTITSGDSPPYDAQNILINYCFCNISVSPDDAPTVLDKTKSTTVVRTVGIADSNTNYNSGPINPLGAYLYVWITHSDIGSPVTLSLQVVNISSPALGGGIVTVLPGASNTEATTSVNASTSVVTLRAANSSRLAMSIFNNSNVDLYVLHGAGATTSNFRVVLGPSAYYELPAPIYVGIVTGIWGAGATGTALVTEST